MGILAAMAIVGAGCVLWWLVVRHSLLVPSLGKLGGATITPRNLETGDLVFMSGSSWSEKTIQTVSDSPFSHVGMIVVEVGPPENEGGPVSDRKVFIWESDVSGSQKRGPRMVRLETKLAEWPGSKEVYVRKLAVEPDEVPLEHLARLVGKTFDSSMLSWLVPDWEFWVGLTKSPESWFCSELIAHTLSKMGLDVPGKPNSYSPRRLWDLDFLQEPRKLVSRRNEN